MMDGRAGHEQELARGGVFGKFLDGDHLLIAGTDTAGAKALARSYGRIKG